MSLDDEKRKIIPQQLLAKGKSNHLLPDNKNKLGNEDLGFYPFLLHFSSCQTNQSISCSIPARSMTTLDSPLVPISHFAFLLFITLTQAKQLQSLFDCQQDIQGP